MSTNLKEEFSSEEQFTLKSEGFDMTDSGLEMNGKMCGDTLEDALLADPDNCGICGETLVMPRMLYCLHVFCEECLEKKLMDEGGDAGSPNAAIVCPTCEFETKAAPSSSDIETEN